MKKFIILMVCGLIVSSPLLPSTAFAKNLTKNRIAQRQADIKKLHGVVISAIGNKFFEENNYEKIDNTIEQKINAFPTDKQQEIRSYIENSPDPTGMVQVQYRLGWYMANTLHQRLVAMPKLQTPDVELLRQKWIADMQNIDEATSRKTARSITMTEFIEQANAVFKKNGLEQIH